MPGLLAVILRLLLTLGVGIEEAGPSPSSAPAEVLSCADIFRMTQEDEFDPDIADAAEEWSLDPFILKGLLYEESKLRNVINPTSGAAGIAQFTKAGRKGLTQIRKMRGNLEAFTYQHSLDPYQAIPGAAELLSYLVAQWGRDSGIAHYNGGPNKRGFSARVMRNANRFRMESGLPPLPVKAPKKTKRVPLPQV